MKFEQLSFVNVSATVWLFVHGLAARVVKPTVVTPQAPKGQHRNGSLLRVLDNACRAFSNGITTWASAGRMPL